VACYLDSLELHQLTEERLLTLEGYGEPA